MHPTDFRYQSDDAAMVFQYRKCSDNRQMGHVHSNYEILYILSGERQFFIQDNTYRIKPGSLLVIGANVIHRGVNMGEGCELVVINFAPSFLSGREEDIRHLLISLVGSRGAVLLQDDNGRILSMLQVILLEAQQRSLHSRLAIACHLTQLLIAISRTDTLSDANMGNARMHGKAAELTAYLRENFREPITLSALAIRFFMSSSHISRQFREETGFTVIAYLNQLRVKESKRLLLTTNQSVAKIGSRAGFGSMAQFGRVFKEVVGMTPLQYRRNQEAYIDGQHAGQYCEA